jgi:hypothetical protein
VQEAQEIASSIQRTPMSLARPNTQIEFKHAYGTTG